MNDNKPVMTEEKFVDVISGIDLSVEEINTLRKHFKLSYEQKEINLGTFARGQVLNRAFKKIPQGRMFV